MKKMLLAVVSLMALAVIGQAGGERVYHCCRMTDAPALDGELRNDPAWANIPAAGDFVVLGTGARASKQTSVKAGYTADALYIGVECSEPEIKEIKAQLGDWGNLWEEDSVEIFICPQGAKSYILQFVVNAIGSRWCADSHDWQAAARRGKDYWSAEIRIPFAVLKAVPKANEEWRANFCRNILTSKQPSTWSPLTAGFHEPENFGRIIFSSKGLSPAQAKAEQGRAEKELKAGLDKVAKAEVEAALEDSIFAHLYQEPGMQKRISNILGDNTLPPAKALKEINEIRYSLHLKQSLIRELEDWLGFVRNRADTFEYEFGEISKNSDDPELREKARAILGNCEEVAKEIYEAAAHADDPNALSLERVLFLYGKSRAILRDADEARYQIMLRRMFDDQTH